MKNRRILHVYQSPSYSGAEAYALEVATHHASSNDVTFLALDQSVLGHRVPASAKSGTMTLSTSPSSLDFATFDAIVLHSTQELKHLWPRLAWAKFRARITGKPGPKVFLYSHIWISHSKKDPLHAIPYAVVDEAWASSTQSQKALERFLPLSRERIAVVRYGRDNDGFTRDLLDRTEARKKLGIPEDAIVTGTMARVDKGKGSEELFEAVTKVMKLHKNLHFLMIGPPTNGDPKATDLDRELNLRLENLPTDLRARVHKLGRLEDGSTYLKAFDLFILATYKENFALTLLEALAAKVPCLATNSGGSPDVVRPGETGWLFEPESADSLRATLEDALKEKGRWAAFGENGHRNVSDGYDFKNVMRTLDARIESRLTP